MSKDDLSSITTSFDQGNATSSDTVAMVTYSPGPLGNEALAKLSAALAHMNATEASDAKSKHHPLKDPYERCVKTCHPIQKVFTKPVKKDGCGTGWWAGMIPGSHKFKYCCFDHDVCFVCIPSNPLFHLLPQLTAWIPSG